MRLQQWRHPEVTDYTVEAVQLDYGNAKEIQEWCDGVLVHEQDPFDSSEGQPGINVPTNVGNKRASVGDYILRLRDGSFTVRDRISFESQMVLK